MKFYTRTIESAELRRMQNLSFNDHSRLTIVTGKRRTGKTTLILKSVRDLPTVYLFISRKKEAMLCSEFIPIITQSLKIAVREKIRTFRSLFQYLMTLAVSRPFNLVIDEFQEFYNINESVYGDMQRIWDTYREKSKMNLIVSGLIHSATLSLFRDVEEPFFGRADCLIRLSAFELSTLKEIIHDCNPAYTNDDLLALYSFTGGVPKYVELLCDHTALSVNEMIAFMAQENSPFIDEGKRLLTEDLGKNHITYFSILSAVSGGITTQPEIEEAIGDQRIGGHIKRLVEDYNILVRQRPILAKEGSKTVRYEIPDNFIRFWLNYFDRYRSLIEIKDFTGLQNIIRADYPTYSATMLERYFKQQFAESFHYHNIGSWWEAKGNQPEIEIDIIALKLRKKQAIAVEVRRQKADFKPKQFVKKVQFFNYKLLPSYRVNRVYLSLEDM
ncbi:MAG: AAA family ATPase [Tannerellaceae bacterium]|jgi:AAA+ ATPase superfamily predicted ATPase|nr:AAA family ATPase [Tannerellaceae bacterium]